jgi:hypothetical protein
MRCIPLPAHAQVEATAAGLPPDWAATVWLMHGCGLRIGEALAVSLRCRIYKGKTLRVSEQVNPAAQLRPLKFRKSGEFRDISLPQYVSEAIDKHVAEVTHQIYGHLVPARSTAPAPSLTPPTRRADVGRPGSL